MRRSGAEERAHGVACRPERAEVVREQDVARSPEDGAGLCLEDEVRRPLHIEIPRRLVEWEIPDVQAEVFGQVSSRVALIAPVCRRDDQDAVPSATGGVQEQESGEGPGGGLGGGG